jgi:hypothetical protein
MIVSSVFSVEGRRDIETGNYDLEPVLARPEESVRVT